MLRAEAASRERQAEEEAELLSRAPQQVMQADPPSSQQSRLLDGAPHSGRAVPGATSAPTGPQPRTSTSGQATRRPASTTSSSPTESPTLGRAAVAEPEVIWLPAAAAAAAAAAAIPAAAVDYLAEWPVSEALAEWPDQAQETAEARAISQLLDGWSLGPGQQQIARADHMERDEQELWPPSGVLPHPAVLFESPAAAPSVSSSARRAGSRSRLTSRLLRAADPPRSAAASSPPLPPSTGRDTDGSDEDGGDWEWSDRSQRDDVSSRRPRGSGASSETSSVSRLAEADGPTRGPTGGTGGKRVPQARYDRRGRVAAAAAAAAAQGAAKAKLAGYAAVAQRGTDGADAAVAARAALLASRGEVEEVDAGGGGGAKLLHRDSQRMYAPSRWLLGGCVGQLELAAVPGGGWAVLTTASASVGDLLMVSEPLALAVSPEPGGLPPRTRALLRLLALQQQDVQLAATAEGSGGFGATTEFERSLPLMWRGEEDPGRGQQPSVTLVELAGRGGQDAVTDAWQEARRLERRDAERRGSSGGDGGWQDRAPLELQQLARVVELNAYGDVRQDAAAAACRKEPTFGHLGLWPAFSMLNHSCAPNAVHLVVGDRMIIRANQDIKAGVQVTINYLGRGALAPWASRHQDLEAGYGFACHCDRCRGERGAYHVLGRATVQQVVDTTEQLLVAFEDALGARDVGDLRAVHDSAQELVFYMESLYEQAGLAPLGRSAVDAALYDLYELQAVASDALLVAAVATADAAEAAATAAASASAAPAPDAVSTAASTSAPAAGTPASTVKAAKAEVKAAHVAAAGAWTRCLGVLADTLPGCDLLTLGSAKLTAQLQQRFGARSTQAQQAARLCQNAHLARYGPLSAPMQRVLIAASARCAEELDRQ